MAARNEKLDTIAAEVNLAMTPEEASRLKRPRPFNPEAHEATLRARLRPLGTARVVDALRQGHESGYASAMLSAAMEMGRQSEQHYVAPTDVARFFVHAGQDGRAIDWLENGYRERDLRMHMIYIDPDWEPLREDRRYQDLMRRMKFPKRRP